MRAASTPTPAPPDLLNVEGLTIAFSADGPAAVRDVSFRMGRERLAVVGESGSGKSVLFRSLLRLLPGSARVQARRLDFAGTDLQAASPAAIRRLRGRRIGFILQDPHHALHPTQTLGAQIAEMLRLTQGLARRAAWERTLALLDEVRIARPAQAARLYPHQVSGGMGQRAMIAMALAGEPELLIADEATSALDAVVRHEILALIDAAVEQRGMGLVLISHDLDLVARHADRVLVMYQGRLLETLAATRLNDAAHPYTRGLLACRPALAHIGRELPTLQRSDAWLA
ncbi:MAG: ABC transporter ATP-binding protein [Comamonas sp.]